MKLLFRLVYPFTVLTVDNEDETLSTGVVVPPERTNLVLSSDIPHGERDVLVLDGLNVEACEGLDMSERAHRHRTIKDSD